MKIVQKKRDFCSSPLAYFFKSRAGYVGMQIPFSDLRVSYPGQSIQDMHEDMQL